MPELASPVERDDGSEFTLAFVLGSFDAVPALLEWSCESGEDGEKDPPVDAKFFVGSLAGCWEDILRGHC